ncbi:rhodanese-like domain-containing protein [Streptomyces sp. H10-C2]|uniref:rhodanese-like domain-containing protein n=1 Tax=unclassified Streptomyces TaxID=2593676 RepID=UPI0024BAB807|nr:MULTISPECIES: rhodanese-like domain-containing protein [unclassified Streptomyces]MDJ0344912.1 rhodanese-like domain-containing protein [Streptomyces sp. PH10-H1]MDJ0373830.1 rhodanese-like domain-containing protein [Streptomyces sp. H10-C2]
MNTPTAVVPAQAAPRLEQYTVIDVRTPGEYAAGHVPGAHNIPLDHLHTALPALKSAAARGDLLMVCATGNRSTTACEQLAAADIHAATLTGGTTSWSEQGHTLHRLEGAATTWAMERQVRLAAGALVVLGLAAGARYRPARWLSAAIGTGLVFSAATNTCGVAAVLAKLPHNQPRTTDLTDTLDALQQ